MELKETPKPKRSIIDTILLKRSTKITPHPVADNRSGNSSSDDARHLHPSSSSSIAAITQTNPFQCSSSTSSTPVKRLYKASRLHKLWQCHGSSLSLASNHSAPSNFLRKTSENVKRQIRNTVDRHSHPIGCHDPHSSDASQCCVYCADNNNSSATDRNELLAAAAAAHDDAGASHWPHSVAGSQVARSISRERFVDSIPGGGKTVVSKSQEQIIVNDIDEVVVADWGKQRSPTSKSHDGNFQSNRVEPTYPYANSIAMSACRSRLREKLLPPGFNLAECSSTSHSAVATAAHSAATADHSKHSRSFSCDTLQNAKRSGRTESLAKHSLMAAQLINLIPTEVARERNFLANNLAVNSLLGPAELDRVLPLREIKVFVGTWNMNGQHPPKQMNDFVFPAGVEHVPDLVAIGTQESCSERFEWEVILQETLGPTHVMFHSTSLGTLHLAVFIRRDLIWFCSVPEDDCLSVRPGTAFRTKGAIAISFCLFGTSMLFVTSHLTAHQQKVKERVSDVKRIIHALDLPKNLHLRSKNRDVTQNFDAVFWGGDLNFRLGEPRDKILKWIDNTQFPLPSHLPHGYMHTDQLKSVLANGAAFKDFKEANITFPPTYKYDPGTQKFDTSSKQRAPAYTDRILFKYKSNPFGLRRDSNLHNFLHSAIVECIAYDSVPSIVSSDHKPVWALFKTSIKPGIDSIPLAAGLFNRDVYIEGMKRRLTKKPADTSNACCIQ